MNQDMSQAEHDDRAEKARKTGACDHEVGICWGRPLKGKADHDEDKQLPLSGRKRRRIAKADRASRQKKGNRAFRRAQRDEQYRQDTIRMQLLVLKTRPADDPMYQNVYNGLVAKYGPEIKAMIEAEQTGVAA